MMTAMIATMLLTQATGHVAVESLLPGPGVVEKMEKVGLQVIEDDKVVTYIGVPLASILARRDKPVEGMAGLKALSDAVLLVRATDGYQVAYSAAAVAMDPKGERYLLATARDGKPLDADHGPLRVIVPGDPKHARWIRNVSAIRLIKLDKLVSSD